MGLFRAKKEERTRFDGALIFRRGVVHVAREGGAVYEKRARSDVWDVVFEK